MGHTDNMNKKSPDTMPRWDLSVFYPQGIEDPEIDRDIERFEERAKKFQKTYEGNLSRLLGEALVEYIEIQKISSRVGLFLFLAHSLDTGNERVKTVLEKAERKFSLVGGTYLTFFQLEIVNLSDGEISSQKKHPAVMRHGAWLADVRRWKPHLLSQEVEAALAKRTPFGSGSWDKYSEEVNADLIFNFRGEEKTQETDPLKEKILRLLQEHDKRMSQKELRKQFPFSEAKMSLAITELENEGKIKKIKKGRSNILIKQ